MEEHKKKLRMRHTFKDLSYMMEMSYTSIRLEILNNADLMHQLYQMGWHSRMRFNKKQVLEIFKVIGYPDGYEHYEVKQ